MLPVSAEGGIKMLVRRKSSQPQRLFPFERVFEAADGVLHLAFYLVALAPVSYTHLTLPTILLV